MSSFSSINFRIAIVGSHRVRVAKVVSLLSSLPSHTDEEIELNVNIEYIPCVATFDSYENEKGETVRYLMKLEYHEDEGKSIRGSSLAPLFDEIHQHDDNIKDEKKKVIPGITAVAIGCGIESEEDVNMIQSFLNVLSVSSAAGEYSDDGGEESTMLVKCIEPNEEFSSMTEENKIYKSLDAQEKERVTELQSLGPGKMARFVHTLAQEVLEQVNPSQSDQDDESQAINDDIEETKDEVAEEVDFFKEYDTNITRFACKICRTILFSVNELQDPPHTKAQHDFSSRKSRLGSSSQCQSVFLEAGLDWMGDISDAYEGKITCHNCSSKLGLWKWAGAQCSCGTWVTPAIQIQLGRVDVVTPKDEMASSYEITPSPLAALHVAGMRPI